MGATDLGFLVFLGGLLYVVVMLLKMRGLRLGTLGTLFVDACGAAAMYTYFDWGFVEILVVLLAAEFIAAVIRGSQRRHYY